MLFTQARNGARSPQKSGVSTASLATAPFVFHNTPNARENAPTSRHTCAWEYVQRFPLGYRYFRYTQGVWTKGDPSLQRVQEQPRHQAAVDTAQRTRLRLLANLR